MKLHHTTTTTTTTSISRLFSTKTWVSRHQKGKPFWILLEQEMMGWQWHQLDHMQIVCISLQTDNHASISALGFLQAVAPSHHLTSNLTRGLIATTHGWFSHIHQVVPMCTPSNTCFLGPTHHPKLHYDQFSHFCTAHGRESILYNRSLLSPPSKLIIRMGDLDSLLIYGSLVPPEPTIKMAS